ncbi:MAG TPA: TlpA disulfide reductase family protein [Pyrinomonadaceae bacterium]|nr:TlpA disulfide reductase family protein [Pyrinomonadaceae bacterium]
MFQTLARTAAVFTLVSLFAAAALAQDGHEYAPLVEQKIDYKDWTFKSLKDGSPVNLRELLKGKKLVMVVYFAPWCGNWKFEAPVVARLYETYKKHGFDVVAVSEYASADDTRKHFEAAGGAPYTVVVESEAREARDQTTHYAYRQASNDTRRWGSPFNVFLEPERLNPKGEVLAEKAWVVGGELIEKDAERFIRKKLGLAEKDNAGKLFLNEKEQAGAGPCQDKPATALMARP